MKKPKTKYKNYFVGIAAVAIASGLGLVFMTPGAIAWLGGLIVLFLVILIILQLVDIFE